MGGLKVRGKWGVCMGAKCFGMGRMGERENWWCKPKKKSKKNDVRSRPTCSKVANDAELRKGVSQANFREHLDRAVLSKRGSAIRGLLQNISTALFFLHK